MNSNKPPEIIMLSIDRISIINPRNRNRDKFRLIIQNIAHVGLKKPIIVSKRKPNEDGEPDGYDLVCGQGRIEAYLALGKKEIPAIIIDVSREDRLIMSLVENMARRHHSGVEQISEIIRLKKTGNTLNRLRATRFFRTVYSRSTYFDRCQRREVARWSIIGTIAHHPRYRNCQDE